MDVRGFPRLGYFWDLYGLIQAAINRACIFLVLGIVIIYLVNVLRIATLMLMQEWAPQFFDITHDYSTTTIFYLVIFLLWMLWVRIAEGFGDSTPQISIQDS